jgi:hypothetical protein
MLRVSIHVALICFKFLKDYAPELQSKQAEHEKIWSASTCNKNRKPSYFVENFTGYNLQIITFPYKNLPDGKTSNETKLHLSLLIV